MLMRTLSVLCLLGVLATPTFADDPPAAEELTREETSTDRPDQTPLAVQSEVVAIDGETGDELVSDDPEPVENDGGLFFRLGRSLFGAPEAADETELSERESKDSDQESGDSEISAATHRQVRTITFKVDGRPAHLYTFKTTPEGDIVAVVGVESGEPAYETQIVDDLGMVLKSSRLEVTPSGVAVAPDGTIYVGGSGRLLQLDRDLNVVKAIDSPHVGNVDEYRAKLLEKARKEAQNAASVYESQLQTMQAAIEKIEAKEELTRIDKARLKMYRDQSDIFKELIAEAGEPESVDESELEWAIESGMRVTSMAASKDHVFVCASGSDGYGKSVYRISRDLDPESSTVVLAGMSGCCGQFDVQCCEEGLICSENIAFKVALYDFDGHKQSSFGRRDRSSRAGFGSCCNPMNSLPMTDGTVLTAESSIGHIKRFDTDGNLVAYIGKAKIGSGCKHCALGYDGRKDLYFMMAEDDAAICVLAPLSTNPLTEADLRSEAFEADALQRLAGSWEAADEDVAAEVPFGSMGQIAVRSLRFQGQSTDLVFVDLKGEYYGLKFNLENAANSAEVGRTLHLRIPQQSGDHELALVTFIGPNTVDLAVSGTKVRYVRTSDAKGNACESDGCEPRAECAEGCTDDCCSGSAGCVTDGDCQDEGPARVVTASR